MKPARPASHHRGIPWEGGMGLRRSGRHGGRLAPHCPPAAGGTPHPAPRPAARVVDFRRAKLCRFVLPFALVLLVLLLRFWRHCVEP